MKNSITIRQSVFINLPKETVWDFTQNYDNRTRWDKTISEAIVLQTDPQRVVKLKTGNNTIMTFIYKLDDRPNKTTLAAKEIQSPILESGGGSWVYEEQNNGTLWTQTNTLFFKRNFLLPLLLPFYKWVFENQTRKGMMKAKKIMEGDL